MNLQLNLFFSPFDMYVRRVFRRRMWIIRRGYRNLKKSGRMNAISAIQRELTTCNLNIDDRFFSARFFGAGFAFSELVVRQYLLTRLGGKKLNRALLLAAGESGRKVVFSMPLRWVNVIEKNGFQVNRFASAILWFIYIILAYLSGLLAIGKFLFSSLRTGRAQARKYSLNPYVYFCGLVAGNIPHGSTDSVSYDIMSWYLQWQGKRSDIVAIKHSVSNVACRSIGDIKIVEQSDPLSALVGRREFVSYLNSILHAHFIAFFDLLRLRWWHALLLNEASLAIQARIVPSDFLAREYLFNNSDWIYRPLWTYEVESRGSTILFYFYSTNIENFRLDEGFAPLNYGWAAINWPRYLVWDNYQANFVREAAGEAAKIDVVGPIWFIDKRVTLPIFPLKTVAVFDVQPKRISYCEDSGLDFEYLGINLSCQFLENIIEALANIGGFMAHKRKRDIGRLAHPVYRTVLERLKRSRNYLTIDPDVSAISLIQKCDVVISMPFTATALLGLDAGKPSIYYDPTGLLRKDDPASHGVEIIQDLEELGDWLVKNLGLTASEVYVDACER